ncbi:hypothetical protein F4803DRAFT_548545 [Xylaria telfairii]|nr:hypothetical protein F4803DRAFT_548545 [Xylaria telfairii]
MDPDSDAEPVLGVDPNKVVTKEELYAKKAQLLNESPNHVILHETPTSNTKLLEKWLKIAEGTLPNFTCIF